jgi:hypothetical protein
MVHPSQLTGSLYVKVVGQVNPLVVVVEEGGKYGYPEDVGTG